MSGIHRLLYGMLAGGGEVATLRLIPDSSLLDTRSPFSGTVNFDTEVRAKPAEYANAILSAAAATCRPRSHSTSVTQIHLSRISTELPGECANFVPWLSHAC